MGFVEILWYCILKFGSHRVCDLDVAVLSYCASCINSFILCDICRIEIVLEGMNSIVKLIFIK